MIRVFSNTLASFCNDLQRSCDALRQSVDRRPIPLDSASSTFVRCLNRRVSSTSSDLNMIESMSFGFCSEVYEKNQSDLTELEDRLGSFGYVPANKKIGSLDISVRELMNPCNKNQHGMKGQCRPAPKFLDVIAGEAEEDLKSVGMPQSVMNISKDEYESLPSYMKTLASWEDLLAAVEKMNSILSQKKITKGGSFFHQDDLASLDLGPKGRSYLMLLLRTNCLAVETMDGLISY